MNKLPKKISELFQLALNDYKKVKKDKNYRIEMANWHVPAYKKKLLSCLFCRMCDG